MKTRGGRRRFRWVGSFLLLVCGAVSARAAGEYQTVEIESLKIVIDYEWGARNAPGYLPDPLEEQAPDRSLPVLVQLAPEMVPVLPLPEASTKVDPAPASNE